MDTVMEPGALLLKFFPDDRDGPGGNADLMQTEVALPRGAGMAGGVVLGALDPSPWLVATTTKAC